MAIVSAPSCGRGIGQISARWSVAGRYLKLGVEHILLGIDHLLFVLALLIITHGIWLLIMTVTAHHSLGGEVEGSNTSTIRRVTPSCPHNFRTEDTHDSHNENTNGRLPKGLLAGMIIDVRLQGRCLWHRDWGLAP